MKRDRMKRAAKFAVSMPEVEFRDVESMRRRTGKSRSQFVRDAVQAWKAGGEPSGAGQSGLRQSGAAGRGGRGSWPSIREEARGYGAPPLPDLADEAERRRRAIAAAGRFSSGGGDLAARHDEELAEAYAGSGKAGSGDDA
jgi:hypothetical protein